MGLEELSGLSSAGSTKSTSLWEVHKYAVDLTFSWALICVHFPSDS